MLDAIQGFSIFFHAAGSILLALGMINVSVISVRYWLKTSKKKFLIGKIPHAGNAVMGYAVAFLFLSMIFVMKQLGSIPAENQWPRILGVTVLLAFGVAAVLSIRRIGRDFSRTVKE